MSATDNRAFDTLWPGCGFWLVALPSCGDKKRRIKG
jgi:hypothetical protein